jgi:hypothetical protein
MADTERLHPKMKPVKPVVQQPLPFAELQHQKILSLLEEGAALESGDNHGLDKVIYQIQSWGNADTEEQALAWITKFERAHKDADSLFQPVTIYDEKTGRTQRKSGREAEKRKREEARRNLADIQTELYEVIGDIEHRTERHGEWVFQKQWAVYHLLTMSKLESAIEAAEAKRDVYATRQTPEWKLKRIKRELDSLGEQKSGQELLIEQSRQDNFEYKNAYDAISPIIPKLESAYAQNGVDEKGEFKQV